MNRFLQITALCVLSLPVPGQTSLDILTERYVDRPIGMHRGQLQFNTGYDFSIINRKYDLRGEEIDLATDGSASSRHLFPFRLEYGILDFLQVSASINYARMGIRSQNHWYETGVGTVSTREVDSYRGMDDLFLGIGLSDPFRLDFLDVFISGGISLPLFDHKPGQPSHRVEVSEPYPGPMDIEYLYNFKFGKGVPVAALGAAIKLRSNPFSAGAFLTHSSGLKEGESVSWESRLSRGEIAYREVPYQYGLGSTVDYRLDLAWQAIDWFAVLASLEGFQNTGAWSTETGKKVLEGKTSLHAIGIGYDIQVAPALRLSQKLILPITGRNILAPRIFQTGISLNFMAPGPG